MARKREYTEEQREEQRARIRRHYEANKDYYIKKAYAFRVKIQQRVRDLKEASPCVDCGKSYPHYVMDFDHRGDDPKIADITNILKKTSNWVKVQAEIDKCDLVCSNCHRERTFQRWMNAS